jgi:hypothetical protein
MNKETIDNIRCVLRNNNDYYWDRPKLDKISKEMAEYSEKYFKLAMKWIELNDALTRALEVIEQQRARIVELENDLCLPDQKEN